MIIEVAGSVARRVGNYVILLSTKRMREHDKLVARSYEQKIKIIVKCF
jgi:hypothetical protein